VPDSTEAFRTAVDAVGLVWMHHSRVVLRGAGRGRTCPTSRRPCRATRGGSPWLTRPLSRRASTCCCWPRTPPDSSLLAYFAGEVPGTSTYPWDTAASRLRPELTDWVLAENFSHYRFPVRIKRAHLRKEGLR
jgi:hypothetical protein